MGGKDLNSGTAITSAVQNDQLCCSESVSLETRVGSALAAGSQPNLPATILLVEDEAFVRRVAAEVLESAGYRLLVAGSAAEAFEACRNCYGPIDLLLADVIMPGMSGRELAAKLRSLGPRGGVVLMSGYPEELARGDRTTRGIQYLAKPFSVDMLLQRVREALDLNLFDSQVRP